MEQREESLGHGAARARSRRTLGWVFLRIGVVAFGGLGTSLALIERELVTKRQWLTAADVTEALTYTKLLPGSTGPQLVAYLGYKLSGWSGSAHRCRAGRARRLHQTSSSKPRAQAG